MDEVKETTFKTWITWIRVHVIPPFTEYCSKRRWLKGSDELIKLSVSAQQWNLTVIWAYDPEVTSRSVDSKWRSPPYVKRMNECFRPEDFRKEQAYLMKNCRHSGAQDPAASWNPAASQHVFPVFNILVKVTGNVSGKWVDRDTVRVSKSRIAPWKAQLSVQQIFKENIESIHTGKNHGGMFHDRSTSKGKFRQRKRVLFPMEQPSARDWYPWSIGTLSIEFCDTETLIKTPKNSKKMYWHCSSWQVDSDPGCIVLFPYCIPTRWVKSFAIAANEKAFFFNQPPTFPHVRRIFEPDDRSITRLALRWHHQLKLGKSGIANFHIPCFGVRRQRNFVIFATSFQLRVDGVMFFSWNQPLPTQPVGYTVTYPVRGVSRRKHGIVVWIQLVLKCNRVGFVNINQYIIKVPK